MRLDSKLAAVLFGAAIAIVQPLVVAALTASQVSAIAQQITVRIDGANTGSGVIIEREDNNYTSDGVTSVAFSPDDRTLASGSRDKTIKIWNLATGQEITTLNGHSNWVTSVAFSPDGRTLASGSDDATIKIWRLSE
ncbi:MAG: hypothetical protein KME21_05095 [Desmonostoc vinosum HA7617-LM4]|jgi:WD40 repeat protein|nr:hypothetical protein [Desmonostoc vinosum HA7617-LM4]